MGVQGSEDSFLPSDAAHLLPSCDFSDTAPIFLLRFQIIKPQSKCSPLGTGCAQIRCSISPNRRRSRCSRPAAANNIEACLASSPPVLTNHWGTLVSNHFLIRRASASRQQGFPSCRPVGSTAVALLWSEPQRPSVRGSARPTVCNEGGGNRPRPIEKSGDKKAERCTVDLPRTAPGGTFLLPSE
jgi:hypothetical protein